MNFVEILSEAGVAFRDSNHRHCRPGWIQCDCMGCSPDSERFRLGFNLRSQSFNCWACGKKPRVPTLATILGVSEQRARIYFGLLDKDIEPIEIDKPSGKLELPIGIEDLRKAHREYLRSRNFDPKVIEKHWKIQGIGPAAGMLAWRIFIPIHYRGKIVSWTSRSISDKNKANRYFSANLNQEVYNHKTLLYGEDHCHSGSSIIVNEGPTDPWNVGPGAVCTFGTGFKTAQVLKIARYRKRIICYDSGPEGQKMAKELCELLMPFDGETINVVLDAEDPGSASKKEIKLLRKLLD